MKQRLEYTGFTLVELLIVIAIIGTLTVVVLGQVTSVRESARIAKAESELRSLANSIEVYKSNHGTYPPNAAFGLPSELNSYLPSNGIETSAWTNSSYNWNTWTEGGQRIAQLSVRFCPENATSTAACVFPNKDWAENFDEYSAILYCLEGPCRAHQSQNSDHPAYCTNCPCRFLHDCN